MEIVAALLSKLLADMSLVRLERLRGSLGRVVRRLARQVASQAELRNTLEQIAELAQYEFRADIVTLYEADPLTNRATSVVTAGRLNNPEDFEGTVNRSYNLVHRILDAREDLYFHSHPESIPDDDPVFGSREKEQTGSRVPFRRREGIESRIIIRLRTDEVQGLMFLNYRKKRGKLLEEEKESLRIFADLAALAIEKARLYQQLRWTQEEFRAERKSLSRQLHDEVGSVALMIKEVAAAVALDESLTPTNRALLSSILEAIDRMNRSVKYVSRLAYSAGDDLRGEIENIVRWMRAWLEGLHEVDISVTFSGNHELIPSEVVRQFSAILLEAIMNAVKHSGARSVLIACSVTEESVTMKIEDNGTGFENPVRHSGLANMRSRAEAVHGRINVQTEPGKGTTIVAMAPTRRESSNASK